MPYYASNTMQAQPRPCPPPMSGTESDVNVFFDVDETILCSSDESLRPLVRDVFRWLNDEGHAVHVWSGVGLRWREIDQHQLRDLIVGSYLKPMQNYRRSLPLVGVTVEPDFVVDDHPDIVRAFGGHTIKPYLRHDPADREMLAAYEAVRAHNHP